MQIPMHNRCEHSLPVWHIMSGAVHCKVALAPIDHPFGTGYVLNLKTVSITVLWCCNGFLCYSIVLWNRQIKVVSAHRDNYQYLCTSFIFYRSENRYSVRRRKRWTHPHSNSIFSRFSITGHICILDQANTMKWDLTYRDTMQLYGWWWRFFCLTLF